MADNKVQAKIALLNSYQENSDEYDSLYEEIMLDIAGSKDLYTILRKESSLESIKDGTAPIFCGISYNNIPTIWLFTEESIAKEYTLHYNMIKDDMYLYKKVTINELTVFSFHAMFSGVSGLIVDEGQNTLITNIYDLVNTSLISMGKQPVLNKQEYKIMNLFNHMKYSNKKLWIIPAKGTTGEELMFNNFYPLEFEKVIKVYESQEICEDESLHYGFKNKFAVSVGMNGLYQVLNHSKNKGINEIIFVGNDFEVKMSFIKVLNILEHMKS